MENIELDGMIFRGSTIELLQGKLLIIQGKTGMLGCGYFNLAVADKLNSAMAVVTGVQSYDDMLNKCVSAVSARAAALGVVPGMTGREALLIMK